MGVPFPTTAAKFLACFLDFALAHYILQSSETPGKNQMLYKNPCSFSPSVIGYRTGLRSCPPHGSGFSSQISNLTVSVKMMLTGLPFTIVGS